MNTTYLPDEVQWAGQTSDQLKVVFASLADETPEQRQQLLLEEVSRAIKPVPPIKRKAYLEKLSERFPVWTATASAPVIVKEYIKEPAEPLDPQSVIDQCRTEDLLDVVLYRADRLSGEERAALATKLEAAGLVDPKTTRGSYVISVEDWREMLAKMGMNRDYPLKPERALRLLVSTVRILLALHALIWKVWATLAPRSAIKREGDFQQVLQEYMGGGADVAGQIDKILDRDRRLIGALMGGIPIGSKSYCQKHDDLFNPESIKEVVSAEGVKKSVFGKMEEFYWNKYCELHRESGVPDVMEKKVRDTIASSAESGMAG